MLNAFNADQGNVQKALSVIKTAPANVQAAFKNLLSFVQQIKTDIQNASSEQGLITSFEPGEESPAGDRRHHHLQLVHVGVRRHARHAHHDGRACPSERRCGAGAVGA